jgi:hypothetical protein
MTETKISWSSLRAHTECKQKGYLQRTGKRAKMADQRIFFPGTVTDRVVRDWLAADPENTPGLMPEMVREMVDREEAKIIEKGGKLIWKDSGDRDSIIVDCVEAVTKIEPALNELVLPYDYDVDFNFRAPLQAPHPAGTMETILLIGFMDIIVKRAEDIWAVYDVKHTKNNDYWKKTRGQLSFYDLSVDVMFGAPTVEVGLLQPLCNETKKLFTLEDKDRTKLETDVLSMASDIWKGDFEPNAPRSECYYCDVRHACSRFKPVRQKDGSKRAPLL